MRFVPYIGWAEVNGTESPEAKTLSRVFKFVSIVVLILLVSTWYFERKHSLGLDGFHLSKGDFRLSNAIIWFFYALRITLITARVENKKRFLIENWMNILLVALGVPVLIFWEQLYSIEMDLMIQLHFLLMAALLLPWIETCIESLSDGKLSTTLLTAFGIVILAGVLMAGFDENVKSVQDGIWWAWVTVTTVGYGDIVPLSQTGKIFGALLILMGLGLFSAITANFVTFFAKQDILSKMSEGKEKELLELSIVVDKLNEVQAQDEALLDSLKAISKRLDNLEK